MIENQLKEPLNHDLKSHQYELQNNTRDQNEAENRPSESQGYQSSSKNLSNLDSRSQGIQGEIEGEGPEGGLDSLTKRFGLSSQAQSRKQSNTNIESELQSKKIEIFEKFKTNFFPIFWSI